MLIGTSTTTGDPTTVVRRRLQQQQQQQQPLQCGACGDCSLAIVVPVWTGTLLPPSGARTCQCRTACLETARSPLARCMVRSVLSGKPRAAGRLCPRSSPATATAAATRTAGSAHRERLYITMKKVGHESGLEVVTRTDTPRVPAVTYWCRH